MKIFFDARWTRLDTVDGVSRYGIELATALHKITPITLLIYDKRQLAHMPSEIPYIIINNPISPAELRFARRMNNLNADVVISPLHVIGTGKRNYALLVTLHDVIYYQHPQAPIHLPLSARMVWRAFHMARWPGRLLLDRADHVLTVSHTSKKLIEEYLRPHKPIAIVPNAHSIKTAHAHTQPIQRNLLFMGSFIPYKNAETLIAAMAFLPEYTLHLLSKITPKRHAELQAMIPPRATVKFWNGVSDDQYQKLLASATALMTASYNEGFGLPLIEAMAEGVPVICSDIPIFHEIGQDAALYAPANNPRAFADRVRLLEKPHVRQTAIRLGHERARHYSWDASAQALFRIVTGLTAQKDE